MFDRLIVVAGIGVLLGVAILASTNRRAIKVSLVARALLLQAAIGAFVLFVPLGKAVTELISDGILAIIGYSSAGIEMVFGGLAATNLGFSFVVQVLPVIIFFSALMAVLYHLRVMQVLVLVVGGALQRLIGISRVESLNAAANVFVGLTEAPLAVKPFLKGLTDAQFVCIMVSGVASVAGTVLAAYSLMGVRLDYLLAASFMAAPGGIAMAKLLMPDEVTTQVAALEIEPDPTEHHPNVILAAAAGAADGLRLAVNIGAMLIAFVGLIALLNGLTGGAGALLGVEGLTIQGILGTLFSPLMFLLGVPWQEAATAGGLFGEKLVLNEFVAFLHLSDFLAQMSPRTEAVVTFSLCGFANLSAIAVLLGGLGVLVPAKRGLIGRYGLKVVLAGSLSNLMSAAFVSLMLGGIA